MPKNKNNITVHSLKTKTNVSKKNRKNFEFKIEYFKQDQKISIFIGKPEDKEFCYQWQILDFQGTEKDFENLWKKFLEENSCHSCICKINLPFLKDFNFKKINNFYSYYPFSVVYRIDDLDDGKFYVGMCEVEESWNDGYLGSGNRWQRHCHAHESHKYKRTVLKENFSVPLETRNFELQEIKKVFNDENCCNKEVRTQGQNWTYKFCSECNGKNGHHRKDCSQYKEHKAPTPCSECGGKFSHKKTCSHYKESKRCPECGVIRGHKKACSQYKEVKACPECGGLENHHRKDCSQYKEPEVCSECGGKAGRHKKTCSQYKELEICPECGGKRTHRSYCSKYKKTPCPECGSLSTHKTWYSKYKSSSICQECGGKRGHHKKTCSKAIICSECGYSSGNHSENCSKYKARKSPTPCPECGKKFGHKKFCSKYKEPKVCSECGGIAGRHYTSCSHYKQPKKCEECGGIYGHHDKKCSKYNHSKSCSECGGLEGKHKKGCSKYKEKEVCAECGGKGGKHKKGCSQYK